MLSCLALNVVLASAASAGRSANGTGWIRFAAFVSSGRPVDVMVGKTVVGTDLSFRDVTGYIMVPAGMHTVTVVRASDPSAAHAIVVGRARVLRGSAVTVAAIPSIAAKSSESGVEAGGIGLKEFTDNLTAPPAGHAEVRLIHTIPGAPRVTTQLTATSGALATVHLSATGYGQASPYVPVTAGTYRVVVKAPNGATVVKGNHLRLAAGTVVSMVVVESPSGPTLDVVKDAVATANDPAGGMQTGLGGTARPPATSVLRATLLLVAAALVLLAVIAGLAAARSRWRIVRRESVIARRGPATRHLLPAAVLGAVASVLLLVALATNGTTRPNSGRLLPPPKSFVPPSPAATIRGLSPQVEVRAISTDGHATKAHAVLTVNLSDASSPGSFSDPTRLDIPAIGVSTRIVPLGRSDDGSAEVPSGFTFAGWYDLGPKPGQVGPAVILGHVDSRTAAGVFFRLKSLLPGDRLTVWDKSLAVTFEVERVATYSKDRFPTASVFGPTPDAQLRLITCGGPFDSATGHYEDNIVVYALRT